MPEYNYNELPVKHIRHNFDLSLEGMHQLWEDRRIAVHWADIRSRDPTDYRQAVKEKHVKSATNDIEHINEIDETGAIVIADYGSDHRGRKGIHKVKMFAGVIPPGTFEYEEYQKTSGETGIYKIVEFDEDTFQDVSIIDRPDLFSDVPARGTINNCNKTETRLRTLVDPEGTVSKTGPEHLSHDQFENISVHYLSHIEYPGAFYLVESVGGYNGNQKVIDINGGVRNTPVVAQVTTATGKGDVQEKIANLAGAFSDGEVKYFFGPQKYADEFDREFESVRYIGAQEVVDKLESNPNTSPLLDRVHGRL